MNTTHLLQAEKEHLADLLEAIQRCVYFLWASEQRLTWPLEGTDLSNRKKDIPLFECLSALNERFAKLQDSLGAAMKHSLLLAGESPDSFLKVLVVFEKIGVLASVENWQTARAARNLAAHDYEVDYQLVAAHFNALHHLSADLLGTARRFVAYCNSTLGVLPSSADFSADFENITASL